MKWTPTKLPRSAPLVLMVLMVGAVSTFAVVGHLVRRFNANRQALGRKIYVQGLADANARTFSRAIDEFRAALSLDPTNMKPSHTCSLFGSVPLKTAPSISRSAA